MIGVSGAAPQLVTTEAGASVGVGKEHHLGVPAGRDGCGPEALCSPHRPTPTHPLKN